MIGYHYTTWEAYQQIRETGLQLSPLEKRHEDNCREVLEFIEDGCIWVYPEHMQGRELIGMVIYAAVRHDSHHLVCLEADYPEWHSAIKLAYRKYVDDSTVEAVNLNHDLMGMGPFGHVRKHFDLITKPVLLEQIHLVGEWNLLDMIQQGETRLRAVA